MLKLGGIFTDLHPYALIQYLIPVRFPALNTGVVFSIEVQMVAKSGPAGDVALILCLGRTRHAYLPGSNYYFQLDCSLGYPLLPIEKPKPMGENLYVRSRRRKFASPAFL